MKVARVLVVGAAAAAMWLLCAGGTLRAEGKGDRVVRLAEIEVDPAQIEPYKAALREGIEAAIRLEPGVLALYAVSVKGHPEQIRLFEMYASEEAYRAHLGTPHFKKYKAATAGMVKVLRLIDTEPVMLGAKSPKIR